MTAGGTATALAYLYYEFRRITRRDAQAAAAASARRRLSDHQPPLNRLLLVHLGWSAVVLAAAGLAIGAELTHPARPVAGWPWTAAPPATWSWSSSPCPPSCTWRS